MKKANPKQIPQNPKQSFLGFPTAPRESLQTQSERFQGILTPTICSRVGGSPLGVFCALSCGSAHLCWVCVSYPNNRRQLLVRNLPRPGQTQAIRSGGMGATNKLRALVVDDMQVRTKLGGQGCWLGREAQR